MPQDLSALGFDRFFAQQVPDPNAVFGRIAAEYRAEYIVWTADGETRARLAGRFALAASAESLPGVGDWVVLRGRPASGQTAVIERVLSRRTVFVRGASGREAREQVVAANVDLIFIVCGLDGDYNVRRIERYVARAWAGGAEAVVVLNKADICDVVGERIVEVETSCPGVTVVAISALRADHLSEIRDRIFSGVTAALLGSSGAGKSTIANALLGEERMATREVRARDDRGCHTTTHRQIFRLPGGGLLVDTPGMRELRIVDEDGLDEVFADIADLALHCRFKDCSHQSEPGCAVREAVANGELRAERVAHFHKLEAEARAYLVRHDQRARRRADRAFGRRIAGHGKLARRLKGDG